MGKLIIKSVLILLAMSVNAQASIVSVSHDWPVLEIEDTGNFLDGLVAVGDKVHVEAFYNTDEAKFLFAESFANYYVFPAGQAGLNFTVNNLTWKTTGPLTISIWPVNVRKADGQSFGGPVWNGYTTETIQGIVPTTMSTPIDVGNVQNQAMLFHPSFVLGSSKDLPTSLDTLASKAYGFNQGGMHVRSTDGSEYRCHFGNTPVPLPASFPLILSGIVMLMALANGFPSRY